MKATASRNIAIVAATICIILTISLIGTIANYTTIINTKDNTITNQNTKITSLKTQQTENNLTILNQKSTITNLTSQIKTLNNKILENNQTFEDQQSTINKQISQIQNLTTKNNQIQNWLKDNITAMDSQIYNLNSNITKLQDQIDNFQDILNLSQSKLKTLVFHVCEKVEGSEGAHIPDVNYTYNQILSLNNDIYDILLLPEYNDNGNWTETFTWLKENFQEIPIMLPIFEGGNHSSPLEMLAIPQILEAIATLNVKSVRIFEIASWHIENNLPFPTEYITTILTFCKANNLPVFWSEWKDQENVFQNITSYITGFEDIVTVSFSTNSQFTEPADSFMRISQMFQHWGGSIQPWYWQTRYGVDLMNMPASLLVEHALLAKNIGAEIIQFEPYWYFFDNGQPTENLKLLMAMLT